MKISKNISLISVVIAVGFLSLLMSKLWPAFNTTTQREIDLIESLDTDLLENLVDSKKDIKKFTFQVAELDQKSIMVDIGLDSLLHIPESDIGPKGIFIRDHDWIILNLTSLKSSLRSDFYETVNINYAYPLQINDLLKVDSLSATIKLIAGERIDFIIRSAPTGYNSRAEPGYFIQSVELPLRNVKYSISEMSIIWEQIIIYFILFLIVELFVILVLPKFGYKSYERKLIFELDSLEKYRP